MWTRVRVRRRICTGECEPLGLVVQIRRVNLEPPCALGAKVDPQPAVARDDYMRHFICECVEAADETEALVAERSARRVMEGVELRQGHGRW